MSRSDEKLDLGEPDSLEGTFIDEIAKLKAERDSLQKERDVLIKAIQIANKYFIKIIKGRYDCPHDNMAECALDEIKELEKEDKIIVLKAEIETLRQEVKEYYHRGLNDRGEEVADLKAKLQVAATALEVYAMTNETFPEYGDVAREALQKIRGEGSHEM